MHLHLVRCNDLLGGIDVRELSPNWKFVHSRVISGRHLKMIYGGLCRRFLQQSGGFPLVQALSDQEVQPSFHSLIPPIRFKSACPLVPREPLLDRGANVNTKASSSSCTMTALGTAASEGHTAVVQLLLGREADANAKDNYGRTWDAGRPMSTQTTYFTIGGRHQVWQLQKGIRRWYSCFLNMRSPEYEANVNAKGSKG